MLILQEPSNASILDVGGQDVARLRDCCLEAQGTDDLQSSGNLCPSHTPDNVLIDEARLPSRP